MMSNNSQTENTLHQDRVTDTDLKNLLQGFLKAIIRLPWLETNAGGVFLADRNNKQLDLVAHINFTPQIQGSCTRVAYGQCLCGRVAEDPRLLHVGCLDERHERRYPGMQDHGHYIVPILDSEELLGVLTLYVSAGHTFQQEEANVLSDFAATMAIVIQTARQHQDKILGDMIMENSRHGVMIADRDKRILWVNKAFEHTTGYSLDEVYGKRPDILSSGRHDAEFYRYMWHKIHHEGQWQGEIWNRRKNGEIYPEWLNIMTLRNKHGEVERYAGIFVDLSEIHQAEERIHQLAYFDSLTGLPNRTWFSEKLELLLEQERVTQDTVYVLILDLDHFQEINEALGRDAGDALLMEAGTRLRKLHDQGIMARAEADRFLMAYTIQKEEAPESRAKNILKGMRREFEYGGELLKMSATAGMAMSNLDDTSETLISRAMLALRRAKKEFRSGLKVFDDALGDEARYDHYITLNIQHAVERDELFLVYQPQMDQHGHVIGAEALLRWNSANYGLIPPDRFISYAEKRGVIREIGKWVFEQAARQLSAWRSDNLVSDDTFLLSVNLSPAQLIGGNILDTYTAICAQYGLTPHTFGVEITETAIMQGFRTITDQLEAFSAAGFNIAIDDFGTGHSSLARLHEFPIDTFKIDRSFVSLMDSGKKHQAIVKSMIAMAHELGHTVVAEGVENETQYSMLRDHGCEHFQGYFFSKPLSATNFENFFSEKPLF